MVLIGADGNFIDVSGCASGPLPLPPASPSPPSSAETREIVAAANRATASREALTRGLQLHLQPRTATEALSDFVCGICEVSSLGRIEWDGKFYCSLCRVVLRPQVIAAISKFQAQFRGKMARRTIRQQKLQLTETQEEREERLDREEMEHFIQAESAKRVTATKAAIKLTMVHGVVGYCDDNANGAQVQAARMEAARMAHHEKTRQRLDGYITVLEFSPGGQVLAAGTSQGVVALFRTYPRDLPEKEQLHCSSRGPNNPRGLGSEPQPSPLPTPRCPDLGNKKARSGRRVFRGSIHSICFFTPVSVIEKKVQKFAGLLAARQQARATAPRAIQTARRGGGGRRNSVFTYTDDSPAASTGARGLFVLPLGLAVGTQVLGLSSFSAMQCLLLPVLVMLVYFYVHCVLNWHVSCFAGWRSCTITPCDGQVDGSGADLGRHGDGSPCVARDSRPEKTAGAGRAVDETADDTQHEDGSRCRQG